MKRLLLFSLLPCAAFAQCSGYSTFITATIPAQTTTLTNFTVIVKQTDARFKQTGSGGNMTSANGYDICYADTGNATSYKFQTFIYNGTQGIVNARVNIPTVNSGGTTQFRIYVGNASVTTYQGSTLAWDSNFAQVYPLLAASSPYNDVTANAQTSTGGTDPVQTSPGALGTGDFYEAFTASSSQYIQVPNNLPTGDGTMSIWFNLGALTGAPEQFIDNRVNGSGLGCTLATDGTAHLFAACGANGPITAAGASNDGQWHHGALTIQGNTLRLYLDGVQQAMSTTAWAGFTTGNAYIGRSYTSIHYVTGGLEEARISSSVRSAGWIASEAANMANPATFVTLSGGGSGSFTISPVAVPTNNVAPLVLTLTGVGTTWAAQTFTISGCGTKTGQVVDSTTSVRLLITTDATVCTATVSDGTISAQVPIGPFGGGSGTGAIFVTSH